MVCLEMSISVWICVYFSKENIQITGGKFFGVRLFGDDAIKHGLIFELELCSRLAVDLKVKRWPEWLS